MFKNKKIQFDNSTRKSSKKRKVLVAMLVLLLLLLATTAFAVTQKIGPFAEDVTETEQTEGIDYNEPETDEAEAGEDIKQQTIEEQTKPSDSSIGSSSPSQSGSSTNSSSTTVEITQMDAMGNNLKIRTLIQKVASSEGSCTLTLSKAGQPSVVRTVGIQPLASSSTCKGFDVNTTSLAKGAWNAKIVFNGAGTSGSVSQGVTL